MLCWTAKGDNHGEFLAKIQLTQFLLVPTLLLAFVVTHWFWVMAIVEFMARIQLADGALLELMDDACWHLMAHR